MLTAERNTGGKAWGQARAHSAINCVGKVLQWMLQLHMGDNPQLDQMEDSAIVHLLVDSFLNNMEVHLPRYIHEYLGKQHALKPKSQLNHVGHIKMILRWYLFRLRIEA